MVHTGVPVVATIFIIYGHQTRTKRMNCHKLQEVQCTEILTKMLNIFFLRGTFTCGLETSPAQKHCPTAAYGGHKQLHSWEATATVFYYS